MRLGLQVHLRFDVPGALVGVCVLLANPALIGVPFVLAGSVKVVYDLLLWAGFNAHKPPEETGP